MSAKNTPPVRFKLRRNAKPTLAHKKRLVALSEAELERAARSDPDAPPLTARELVDFHPATPARVRRGLGMSQNQFAEALEIPVATVRDWEQGRYRPDAAARSLLKLIAAAPEAVRAKLDRRVAIPARAGKRAQSNDLLAAALCRLYESARAMNLPFEDLFRVEKGLSNVAEALGAEVHRLYQEGAIVSDARRSRKPLPGGLH